MKEIVFNLLDQIFMLFFFLSLLVFLPLGRVVQKPIKANPRLKNNLAFQHTR